MPTTKTPTVFSCASRCRSTLAVVGGEPRHGLALVAEPLVDVSREGVAIGRDFGELLAVSLRWVRDLEVRDGRGLAGASSGSSATRPDIVPAPRRPASASTTASRRRSRRSATFRAQPYFSASSSRSRCTSSARAGVAGGHVPRLRRAYAVAVDDVQDQLRLGLLAVGLALLFASCRSAINLGPSAHITLCATAHATLRP